MTATKQKLKSVAEVELRPDSWQRFEAANGAAVMSGPQHRMTVKSAKQSRAKPKMKRPKTT